MMMSLAGVTFGYGGEPLLSSLDLDIPHGIVGLLGANGAGKTTLLKILATVLKPQAGTITVAGRELTDFAAVRSARGEIGYLPQDFGYFRGFSVLDFVSYCGWLRGVSSDRLAESTTQAVDAVNLSHCADTRMRKLSGGMLRRAGIASAIVGDPPVVLLDEPTVGLDPEQRLDFRELIGSLSTRTGGCIVLSTHLVEDIAALDEHVVVLDGGEVCFSGRAAELAENSSDDHRGDTPIERGYVAVRRKRAVSS